MTDTLPATLDELAKDIRSTLERAEKNDEKARNLRITAGQMLLAAKERVQSGEATDTVGARISWKDWVDRFIKRSERDVRRLIAIAKAPDPAAAAEEERRKAREGMQRTRTNVSPLQLPKPQPTATDPTQPAAEPAASAPEPEEFDHLGVLKAAWEAAPEDVRIHFMKGVLSRANTRFLLQIRPEEPAPTAATTPVDPPMKDWSTAAEPEPALKTAAKPKLTDEEMAAMRADHAAGMHLAKIARKYGLGYIRDVKALLGIEEEEHVAA
jgi:hypothetical protein